MPAPRENQKACSPKCRARLHRQARAAVLAAQERELRRLLAAARAHVEAAERVLDPEVLRPRE